MRFLIMISLSVCLMSTEASAFTLDHSKGVVVLYKARSGNWLGCGPVQCLQVAEKSDERVADLVTPDALGEPYYVGRIGRCEFFQTPGALRSYDHSVKWVIDRITGKC